MAKKEKSTKKIERSAVHSKLPWRVYRGKLAHRRGRKTKAESLFKVVGEKLPVSALGEVWEDVKKQGFGEKGVYIAHDSMGCPRYIGRGSIFSRLNSCIKKNKLEIKYFSFYIVLEPKHEREIETLLIRSAGFLLEFNNRKKRVGIEAANIKDFEVGTAFYERQSQRGRVKKSARKRRKKVK